MQTVICNMRPVLGLEYQLRQRLHIIFYILQPPNRGDLINNLNAIKL